MVRQLRTLSDYKVAIGDIDKEIGAIIHKSVSQFHSLQEFANDNFGIGPVNYSTTTRANIIHDHICLQVFNFMYGMDGVKVGTFNGVFGFLINNEFFVRFKKMNPKNFAISNVTTRQDQKYRNQNIVIDGLPERPTIVYSGYSLDKSGLNVLGVYTVCRNGDAIEWFDENGVIESQQVSFDLDDISGSETKVEKAIRRFKAKGNDNRDTGTGE